MRALLHTPRNGFMKLSLVEWKVKHRKEIEWCTRCHTHVRNLDEKGKHLQLEKTFQGRTGLLQCVRQLTPEGSLTSHFDAVLGNSLEINTLLRKAKTPNQYRKRAKGVCENKLRRDDDLPCPHF